MSDMEALADANGAMRVEVQVYVTERAPDGKTLLRNPYSVLFLPGLGWTAKNDLMSDSWGSAYLVGRVS